MSYVKNTVRFFLASCIVVCWLPFCTGSTRLLAAEDNSQAADTSADTTEFSELHVTPEGTYAVDSEGTEWEYDYSREEFVREENDTSSTKTVFGRKKDREKIEPSEAPEPPELPDDIVLPKKLKGLKLGAVIIESDEKIKGPIVSVGPVTVRGTVIGDVISYKKITVTSTGKITGDVRAPEIVKMRGGVIAGSRIETGLPTIPEVDLFVETSYTGLIVSAIILSVLLVCGLLATGVAPRPVNRVSACLQKSFVRSFFIGLLAWFLYVPVLAILVLTIIGIPVALIALPIATLLAVVLAIVGLGDLVGQKASRYVGTSDSSQMTRVILGILILCSLWLGMSLFFTSPSGLSNAFATLMLVLAIVVWSIGLTAGVGGVILTRFGRRDYRPRAAEVKVETAPPPPPTPPPLTSDEQG